LALGPRFGGGGPRKGAESYILISRGEKMRVGGKSRKKKERPPSAPEGEKRG